jgi:hypothetical protein
VPGYQVRAVAFASFVLFGAAFARAVTIAGPSGLTVSVSADGSYAISLPNPAWQFSGTIGSPLMNLAITSGTDNAGGAFSEIAFDFYTDAPRHAAIREYSGSPAILFTVSLRSGGPNTFSLPAFTVYPQGLSHIAFSGTFAAPTFQGWNDESPWVSFDSSYNAVILSPASHFMVAQTTVLPSGTLVSGISTQIASLPAGFTQQTLLVIGNGINRTFDTWGNLLTGLTGKVRPANDADATLSRVGYWTDAGSAYYYSTAPGLTYPETLAAVKAAFASAGITLGYLQLDSWFYPKGPSAAWSANQAGIYEYIAATPPFASSLAAFQASLGIPLVTHTRWIDPASPYWQQYQMSGTVSIDPLYWQAVANYLSSSGAAVFEQDWLADKATTAYNLNDGDAFLGNMATAMGEQNVDIQYCSGTARHFLQSSKYNSVTTIRTSQDRFGRAYWSNFLYAGRLASAIGLWPFTDVFMSYETGNLLMATLSGGPVGVGDPIGAPDAKNLRQAARSDGVIVKPDVPLTPIDASFWNDSQGTQAPMITSAYSDFGDLRAWYFFLYAQGGSTQAQFRVSDAGVNQPVYLYDYIAGTGSVVQPGQMIPEEVQDYRYLIAAPLGASGIALLGDIGQFVSLGKKRVTTVEDDGTVHVRVVFAPGEASRTLGGYSPCHPAARSTSGIVGPISYDSSTGQFTVPVMPGPDGTASLEIRRAPLGRRP